MNLTLFKKVPFISALQSFFEELNVPVNYIADEAGLLKADRKEVYWALRLNWYNND